MGRGLMVCVVALIAAACVDNGDTGDAAAQGTLGGPCFPNNTCNGTLVCSLVNGKAICQEGDASVQDVSTNDTTTSDVTSDTASDAPADTGCGISPGLACASLGCLPNQGCCLKQNACTQDATSCGDQNLFWQQCLTTKDCTGATNLCCAPIQQITGSCPATAQINGSATCASNACPTNSRLVCTSNADCNLVQLSTCYPTSVGGTPTTIGLCF